MKISKKDIKLLGTSTLLDPILDIALIIFPLFISITLGLNNIPNGNVWLIITSIVAMIWSISYFSIMLKKVNKRGKLAKKINKYYIQKYNIENVSSKIAELGYLDIEPNDQDFVIIERFKLVYNAKTEEFAVFEDIVQKSIDTSNEPKYELIKI